MLAGAGARAWGCPHWLRAWRRGRAPPTLSMTPPPRLLGPLPPSPRYSYETSQRSRRWSSLDGVGVVQLETRVENAWFQRLTLKYDMKVFKFCFQF